MLTNRGMDQQAFTGDADRWLPGTGAHRQKKLLVIVKKLRRLGSCFSERKYGKGGGLVATKVAASHTFASFLQNKF
jgi:hypothetical protein